VEAAGREADISGDARFVGTWRLISMAVRQPNGEVTQPMGSHPRGMLMYTAGGHMSVQVMHGDRSAFGSGARGGTIEEAAAAFRTYIAYCGTYRVDDAEGAVYHEPDCHGFPNGVGVTLKRYFTFVGDRLLLSADRPPTPDAADHPALVWQRVE
jgi:Lipocalin-like domain